MSLLPLVLDLDYSIGNLPNAHRIDLSAWQDQIRFGATTRVFQKFVSELSNCLPAQYGTVFLGSGDFHHLSWPLISRIHAEEPFQVVVLDNHPDNMRFPFGIHCGSWVREVAKLPCVSHVHVVGITSKDIGLTHALENYWRPLLANRLTYWSLQVDVRWARWVGLASAFRTFSDPDELITQFLAAIEPQPVYLTIDKDVLSPEIVRTNWDQGLLSDHHVLAIIHALRERLVGSDITGEISTWHYSSLWKRMLSGLDAQPMIDNKQLMNWQASQDALNQRLLAALAGY